MNPRHIITMLGGGGGPFPFMMPYEEREDQRTVIDNFIPPRVTKAMEFLHQLAVLRQMRKPAISENDIEIVEQQCLSDEEAATRDAACVVLAKYFDGKLELDQWEKLRHEAIEKKVKSSNEPDGEKMILRCISCDPTRPPHPNCPICHGSGKILVQPLPQQEDVIPDELLEIIKGRRPHPEVDVEIDERE